MLNPSYGAKHAYYLVCSTSQAASRQRPNNQRQNPRRFAGLTACTLTSAPAGLDCSSAAGGCASASAATAFIDDVAENVAAAAAIGITGIQFHDAQQCSDELFTWLAE